MRSIRIVRTRRSGARRPGIRRRSWGGGRWVDTGGRDSAIQSWQPPLPRPATDTGGPRPASGRISTTPRGPQSAGTSAPAGTTNPYERRWCHGWHSCRHIGGSCGFRVGPRGLTCRGHAMNSLPSACSRDPKPRGAEGFSALEPQGLSALGRTSTEGNQGQPSTSRRHVIKHGAWARPGDSEGTARIAAPNQGGR